MCSHGKRSLDGDSPNYNLKSRQTQHRHDGDSSSRKKFMPYARALRPTDWDSSIVPRTASLGWECLSLHVGVCFVLALS